MPNTYVYGHYALGFIETAVKNNDTINVKPWIHGHENDRLKAFLRPLSLLKILIRVDDWIEP